MSTKPNLVLLSGMLGDETLWGGVLERMRVPVEVSCLRSDLGTTVADVAAAALAAAPRSFAVAGHSLGGIVALEMQRQAPHRVLQLALLNTSARPGSPEQQASWSDLRSRTSTGEFAAVAQEMAITTLPAHRREPPLITQNLAMAHAVGSSGLLRQLAAQATRPDSRPTLSQIDVPTVVVIGQADNVCPPPVQQELADGIRGAATEMLSGVGHMCPIEAPEEVAAVLDTWLSTTQTAAPTARANQPRASALTDKDD